jgi:hypothetical protein
MYLYISISSTLSIYKTRKSIWFSVLVLLNLQDLQEHQEYTLELLVLENGRTPKEDVTAADGILDFSAMVIS